MSLAPSREIPVVVAGREQEMKLHAVQDGDQGTVREDTYCLIMEML